MLTRSTTKSRNCPFFSPSRDVCEVQHETVTSDKWYLPLAFVTGLAFPPPLGETQTGERAGSPCDLDHLGFKGLHMLQKGLHGLSCVDDGLREGKSKAWDGGRGGGELMSIANSFWGFDFTSQKESSFQNVPITTRMTVITVQFKLFFSKKSSINFCNTLHL